jgi:hypothetical protein
MKSSLRKPSRDFQTGADSRLHVKVCTCGAGRNWRFATWWSPRNSFVLQLGEEFGWALPAARPMGKVVPGIGDDCEPRSNINIASSRGELAERDCYEVSQRDDGPFLIHKFRELLDGRAASRLLEECREMRLGLGAAGDQPYRI